MPPTVKGLCPPDWSLFSSSCFYSEAEFTMNWKGSILFLIIRYMFFTVYEEHAILLYRRDHTMVVYGKIFLKHK